MACPIEPPVQAALIGVAGVFLTAIVTLFTNSSKLRQDRDLALRKDVYIELLDAVAEAGVMISAVLEEGSKVADAQQAMTQLGGAVAKMQIVAPAHVEAAAFDLLSALEAAYLCAFSYRRKLEDCWERTRLCREHLQALTAPERSQAHPPLSAGLQADL